MKIKDQVLKLLEENKGSALSGEAIAKSLSVSRNAVWKSIKLLKQEGYSISATTNRGYCLEIDNDILSKQSIEGHLSKLSRHCSITVYKSLPSTNSLLKAMAAEGAPEGSVIISEEQTAGRGRLGRSFYSPTGTGIYMSILLIPKFSIHKALFITTAAAVAVARAIEKVFPQKEARIKWVNDIYCDNKKVCGILTESSLDFEGGSFEYAILGIGINVTSPKEDFPEELKNIATSLCSTDSYTSGARSLLAAEILNSFYELYEHLEDESLLREYKSRSLLIGEKITILSREGSIPALALDIDEEFRLKVQLEDGSIKALNSGEVSIRKG